MGQTHTTVMETCVAYKEKMRRYAHQTPKTFLSYLSLYQEMYSAKKQQVSDKESRVMLGLAKLKQGAKDVEKMKIELAEQEEILLASNQECTTMLTSLQVSSLGAKKESDAVGVIRDAVSTCSIDPLRSLVMFSSFSSCFSVEDNRFLIFFLFFPTLFVYLYVYNCTCVVSFAV
jgi:hypothetical protein